MHCSFFWTFNMFLQSGQTIVCSFGEFWAFYFELFYCVLCMLHLLVLCMLYLCIPCFFVFMCSFYLYLSVLCDWTAPNAFCIKTVCTTMSFLFHCRLGNKLVELQGRKIWTQLLAIFRRKAFVKCLPHFPWKIRFKTCWHTLQFVLKDKTVSDVSCYIRICVC